MTMPRRKHPPETGTLPEQTRRLLRRAGLRARKGLGQHFLVDESVLAVILDAACLAPSDTVIEVGPGLGALTGELVKRAGKVIAVELDEKLAGLLEETLSAYDNFTVVRSDILKITPEAILSEGGIKPFAKYRVAANLPYYITSPVLRHFLEAENQPQVMVVMVQKEVAEEIAAKPGKMSLLSVGVQLYGVPEIVGYVPAGCFYPAPEVDSAVVKIVPHEKPLLETEERDSFFSLVRAGFSAARKQLPNPLSKGLSITKPEALSLLEKAGIEPKRRAETLSVDEWLRLWWIYSGVRR